MTENLRKKTDYTRMVIYVFYEGDMSHVHATATFKEAYVELFRLIENENVASGNLYMLGRTPKYSHARRV